MEVGGKQFMAVGGVRAVMPHRRCQGLREGQCAITSGWRHVEPGAQDLHNGPCTLFLLTSVQRYEGTSVQRYEGTSVETP
jgi:hypothetical protein